MIINNSRCRVVGDAVVVHDLRKSIKIKDPKSFWSPAKRAGVWDGFVRYVTENGTFDTGLLQQVCEYLDKEKVKYEFDDQRETFKDLHEVKELGGLEFRGYQSDAVKSVTTNRYKGIKYPRGLLHDATNAGKNLIAAGIFASFSKKRKGLFLIDNKVIFEQAVRELKELLPGEVGEYSTRKVDWNRITVCMIQTLHSRLKKDKILKSILAEQSIIIVDECDTTATKKSFKEVVYYCPDAPIRVGMSGTIFSKWPDDRLRNQDILKFFGPIVHTVTNKELVEQKVSTPPHITFLLGNTDLSDMGFDETYQEKIVRNKKRNKKIWRRVERAFKKGRGPVLILIKLHKHIDELIETCPDTIAGVYKIEYVHHKTKGREGIFDRFNKEKVDVLIASMIIKRGLNLKKIRTLINAAGGLSDRNTVQILGRTLRKDDDKDIVYLEDFYDDGEYIRRHSKRRMKVYEAEGFEVHKLYKKKLPK